MHITDTENPQFHLGVIQSFLGFFYKPFFLANVQILTTLEKVRKIFKHDVHITDTEHPQVHLGVFQSLIGFFLVY